MSKKIVLTGGPCAGKTTAMNWIQNNFVKQGYKVLFIQETATELITGGFTPWEARTNVDFQEILIELQLEKERLFEEAAKKLPNDKILLVCDRGIMDNKAYMGKKDFNNILKKKGLICIAPLRPSAVSLPSAVVMLAAFSLRPIATARTSRRLTSPTEW